MAGKHEENWRVMERNWVACDCIDTFGLEVVVFNQVLNPVSDSK